MATSNERNGAFRTLAAIIVPPWTAMVKYEFRGKENLPAKGAAVLSPNHMSEADPITVAVAVWRLGRAPRFMAKAGLWKVPVLRWALQSSGQVPVERSGSTRAADPMKAARQIVDSESLVIIYPEGSLTRDPDLWPMRGKSGAVRMALQAGIPLIPIAQWGTQNLLPRYSKRIRPFPRKKIIVSIGEPLDLSKYQGKELTGALLKEATEELMTAITALLAEIRGEQAPEKRWNPSEHKQNETGRFDG
ncbi:lysophospholipid acyltransferase family protein [Humidisolicoccus flavus]|uniref:lysophospholipid acyltransferase family protein n=1 Tax=Humidisolicoccus flavus TaxID=3111414 RepID=UPI003244C13C